MGGSWQPNEEQAKYLKLAMDMSTGCLMGKGTVDVATYCANLRRIATQLENIDIYTDPLDDEQLDN